MVEFLHVSGEGEPKMVDVSGKNTGVRTAKACGKVLINDDVYEGIQNNSFIKGPVLDTARIAGILAAKNAAHMIPMCHPLLLEFIDVSFKLKKECIEIFSEIKLTGKTGAEMEALTAVTVAALTIYDMCKSVDKRIVISDIKLIEKTGGKSGHFVF